MPVCTESRRTVGGIVFACRGGRMPRCAEFHNRMVRRCYLRPHPSWLRHATFPPGEGIPQKGRYSSTLSKRTPPQSWAMAHDSSPYTGEPYASPVRRMKFLRAGHAHAPTVPRRGVFRVVGSEKTGNLDRMHKIRQEDSTFKNGAKGLT